MGTFKRVPAGITSATLLLSSLTTFGFMGVAHAATLSVDIGTTALYLDGSVFTRNIQYVQRSSQYIRRPVRPVAVSIYGVQRRIPEEPRGILRIVPGRASVELLVIVPRLRHGT